jgi:hypothetical protein
MIVTHGPEFKTAFASHPLVGFHGTSSLASAVLEVNGFLPKKVLSDQEHAQILQMAGDLGLDTASYKQWLDMRSVSFAKDHRFAINHVTTGGHSGGQGLLNVRDVLAEIIRNGPDESRGMAQKFEHKISALRAAPPVIYMVDLSGIGPRLVDCGDAYNMYWNADAALPTVSEIGPTRIIEKLLLPDHP